MKVYSITTSPATLKVTPIGNRLYRVAEDVTIRVSTSEGVWVRPIAWRNNLVAALREP